MKYVILIVGILAIGIWRNKDFESSGMGDVSIIVPIFLWMAFTIIWLLVFFVAGVELPKITI